MSQKNQKEYLLLQKSIVLTVASLLLLWLIKSVEFTFLGSIAHYGIYPRTLEGMVGIFTAPLIHGSFQHLLANSLSWLLLGIFFFFFYDKIAARVLLILYFCSGFLVWIFAREAYHIGFSGVLFAVASFIMVSGFIRRNVSALVLSFSVLVLFGGMFYGVLPTTANISWESHMMGMAAGLLLAVIFRNRAAGLVDWKLALTHEDLKDDEEDRENQIDESVLDNNQPIDTTFHQIDINYIYKENTVSKDDQSTINSSTCYPLPSNTADDIDASKA
jgi:membrane associated rhomboid family serine protease